MPSQVVYISPRHSSSGRWRRCCLSVAIILAGAVAYKLLPVASLPQVEYPVISVGAGLPGADPETMASAVATPLERQFAKIAGINEMTSSSGLGNASITTAVRSEPRCERRGARCAGGDQCGAKPVAGEPAEQSDVPEDQSFGFTDPDSRVDLRHADGAAALRCLRQHSGAEDRPGGWRRTDVLRRQREAGSAD